MFRHGTTTTNTVTPRHASKIKEQMHPNQEVVSKEIKAALGRDSIRLTKLISTSMNHESLKSLANAENQPNLFRTLPGKY